MSAKTEGLRQRHEIIWLR